jgi:hypothetical protein
MPLMLSKLYHALLEAGATDEAAMAAAEEAASFENRFDTIETRLTRIEGRLETLQQYIDGRFNTQSSELAHVRWAIYLLIGGVVSLMLKAFFL